MIFTAWPQNQQPFNYHLIRFNYNHTSTHATRIGNVHDHTTPGVHLSQALRGRYFIQVEGGGGGGLTTKPKKATIKSISSIFQPADEANCRISPTTIDLWSN